MSLVCTSARNMLASQGIYTTHLECLIHKVIYLGIVLIINAQIALMTKLEEFDCIHLRTYSLA